MPDLRVLVADDQPDILQALRLLLTDAGFEADLVTSAHDVLDRVDQRPYDLLLMDLNYTRDTTSGREGLDLLERVRARDASLPVVVMTGWGSVETAVDAMRRGAKSFVQKPWDDTTLVEVVTREVKEGVAVRRRDARLEHEQDEARKIQRALLPSTTPQVHGCDIATRWTPAAGLGGDWFDVQRLERTRLGIAIADVIGKGVPAALLMSNLQAAVRAFATDDADPADVCGRVNRLLCRNIASGKFVSFCYAVIDLARGIVEYGNAGHNPPLVLHKDGRVSRLSTTGLVLGVSPEWSYVTGTCDVGPGDVVVFFTDGITEATSPEDHLYSETRLLQAIRARAGGSADALAQSLTDEVHAWTGGALQDDATLVVVGIR